jgi:hypothetical protein
MVEGFPIGSRKDYAVIFSYSFARTAMALKQKIFSFDRKLRNTNEASFAQYRDTFNKFLYFDNVRRYCSRGSQASRFR